MLHLLWKFSLVAAILVGSHAEKFSFCKRSDSNIDTCLAKTIENAMRQLKSEIPEYGMKQLDPLPIKTLTVGAGKGSVNLVQHYTDIELSGLSDVSVKQVHYDDQKKTLHITAVFPKITQKGHYSIDGAILSLPVVGDGQSTLALENCQIVADFSFEEIQKDGQTHLKIKKAITDMTTSRLRVNFENLFKGNKALADNILDLINDEWQVIFNDIKQPVDQQYAEVLKNYAQTFFDHVPVDKIFLN